MNAESPLVLIVEDEQPQVEVLRYNLESEGFRTAVANDGEEALLLVDEQTPDLIILDWMLPKLSGIDVCRSLRRRRETKSVPIIMLTARGEEGDSVRGLESGTDDYVVKPFSPKEIIARVRAVLRRSAPTLSEERLEYEGIAMDLAKHRVSHHGKAVHLGPTEYRLLRALMERPTRVFSRSQLIDKVWGHDLLIEPRTVDVCVRRVRRALGEDTARGPIRTVRGVGYALEFEDH